MNYEIVNLEEKILVGIGARTNNAAPNMSEVIGELWQRLFCQNIFGKIDHKKDMTTICLYDAYESDFTGDYDVTIGCEVTSLEGNEQYRIKSIPAGKYAKFVLKGPARQVVAAFWNEFWQMKELERTYQGDFEQYMNSDMENSEIHIYIGIK